MKMYKKPNYPIYPKCPRCETEWGVLHDNDFEYNLCHMRIERFVKIEGEFIPSGIILSFMIAGVEHNIWWSEHGCTIVRINDGWHRVVPALPYDISQDRLEKLLLLM